MTNIRKHRKSFRSVKFSILEVYAFGDLLAAILFNQILWISESYYEGGKFSKFFKPCNHEEYRHGDSWFEFFGTSQYLFNKSLQTFAQKLTKGTTRDPDALVYYWNDKKRRTWYEPNWDQINLMWNGDHKKHDLSNYLYNSNPLNYIGNSNPLNYIKSNTDKESIIQEEGEINSSLANPDVFDKYLPHYNNAIKLGLGEISKQRLAKMLQNPSTEIDWAKGQVPSGQFAQALADFIDDPKHDNLNTGAEMRRRFRKYASTWRDNENRRGGPKGDNPKTKGSSRPKNHALNF